MKIRELMSCQAFTCLPQDSLATAASLLWQHDCGILPVVDHEGRVGATITDRDICMGALMSGRPLADLHVAESMSRNLVSCTAEEDLDDVAQRMSEHQLHRLPVVDSDGKLAGMLTLNDLVTAGDHHAKVASLAHGILVSACRHRSKVPSVIAAPAAPQIAKQPIAKQPVAKKPKRAKRGGF